MKVLKYCLSLCLLVMLFSGCAGTKVIINDLDEIEANEIIVFLSNNNIESQKIEAEAAATGTDTTTKWNIGVSNQDAIAAMTLLTKNGLPRKKSDDLLQLFSGGGLVPSDLEEQIKHQQGLAQQISNVIRKIDGIIDADVQLSFPKEDPLNPQKTIGKTTAAVFVKHQGILDNPNSQLITKIKRLVAGSIQDLSFNEVTVIADRSRFTMGSAYTKDAAQPAPESFVNIWSVVLARDSASRFRIIFFSFVGIIVLLIFVILWLIWKFSPILHNIGIMRGLLSPHQVTMPKPKEEEKKEEPPPESEEDEEEPEDEEDEEDWGEEED